MKCTSCGHPLSVEELRGEDCPYCNTALPHVREAIAKAAKLKELLRDEDGDGVPDIVQGLGEQGGAGNVHTDNIHITVSKNVYTSSREFKPSDHKVRETKNTGTGRGGGCISAIIMLVLAGLGAVGYFVTVSGDSEHPTTTPKIQSTPVLNIQVDQACLVDANGDDVLDVAAELRTFTQGKLTSWFGVLNGLDGSVLSKQSMLPGQDDFQLRCVNKDWVMLAYPNFTLEFYKTRDTSAPMRILLSDKIKAFALGDGCVSIKAQDGSRSAISLPSGVATTCKNKRFRAIHDASPGIMELTYKSSKLVVGARSYHLKTRTQGTKMLKVRVKEAGQTLWSRELPYQKPSFATGVAVQDGRIGIWAAEPGKSSFGFLVGLDEESGEQIYVQKDLGVDHVSNPSLFQSNGRWFILNEDVGIWAFDPQTGAIQWHH
jgi:hypothetical protein